MQIQSESLIRHPLERVYLAYRDELPALVPLIPDIREIVVRSRQETPSGPEIVNLWVAKREPPRAVATVVKAEWFQWEDHARWNDAGHYVDWRLVIPAFPDRVRCGGRNAYVADGPDRTRVILTGELKIDLHNFPGVPGFLARSVGPAVEKFIVELVTPNLTRVNHSLERYLDEKAGR